MADPNFETLLGAIREIKASVDELRPLKASMDEVTTLRDEAFTTFARAERVERVSLSAELSGMHRQIRRLQEEVRTLRGEH